ncbi:MAG: LacI family DNA-binding transcriptional regulator [Capsulimonas sp.]|uniref:LacI family DNA-binding transcriptional regulator n=1 Tax=Capsulimonas sp. TaxID=2494211 RepID=UPI0032645D4F
MSKNPPTLKDVAELAGVSRMAVSTVLNNSLSTVRVSQTTRARILKAATDLGYQPDVTARSLRLQRTDTIGFYNGHGYIDLMDPFAPTIFLGLQSACASFRNHLLLYNGLHLQDQAEVLMKLRSNKADGVVIWPVPRDAELIQLLGEAAKPAIQFASSYPGVPGVVTDDAVGARLLAEHLADSGHRFVLYRRGVELLDSEAARFQAFTEVAAERGMILRATNPADRFDRLTPEEEAIIRAHGGPAGITAIACWHDASAAQVMRFCAQEGIRAPEDVALTGYDGFSWPEFPENRLLTTVVVDWEQIAETCVGLLIERVRGGDIPEQTVIPGALRIGGTT